MMKKIINVKEGFVPELSTNHIEIFWKLQKFGFREVDT